MRKRIITLVLALALVGAAVGLAGCGKDGKIEIVIDGGGVAGNYNSSINMTPSAANPNPYNYLEQLAERWNESSDKYRVKINRNSMNGNRDSVVAYVSTKTGPDVIFQTGATIAEDMNNDYFVDMTEYLAGPNKYVSGENKWSDLYDPQELEASRAPNGNFYSIGIDRNIAGVMYNKDILDAAGVAYPIETFGQFVEAQDKIDAYSKREGLGIIPYTMVDNWYDIVLESALFGEDAAALDVVRKNGIVDSEELCRASSLGLFKIINGTTVDVKYDAYLNIIKRAQAYTEAGSKGNTAVTEFMNGKVAMVSCLGKSMVQVQRQSKVNLGAMGYPILTQADADKYGGHSGLTVGEKGVRRGISGIGTGWWITSAAMKKGTVEACADFLQFVTAPEQNVPMVNKLGYALPLDTVRAGEQDLNPLFDDLVDQFNEDLGNGFYEFHTFNSWGIMGFDYWSAFVVQSQNLYNGASNLDVAKNLNQQFLSSRDKLIAQNSETGAWDVEGWSKLA